MKGKKFLLAFWLSSAAFCFLQIVFGPGGFTETARLKEQQGRLESRLEVLREDNARLTARYKALATSPEAIRLEARALGFFRPGEIPIRTLDGAEFRLPTEEPDLSTIPPLASVSSDASLFFRVAWPLLFLVFYTLFWLVERMWPVDRRTESLFPIPFQARLDFFRK